jgi:hypothetical protein
MNLTSGHRLVDNLSVLRYVMGRPDSIGAGQSGRFSGHGFRQAVSNRFSTGPKSDCRDAMGWYSKGYTNRSGTDITIHRPYDFYQFSHCKERREEREGKPVE